MEVSATNIEEREISAIDDLLPSLLKKGLLTDIECRIIVCSRNLQEKQSVIYKIIISKNKQKAAQLVEMFKAMTEGLHVEEEMKLTELDHTHSKNEISSPFKENKNPMLIDTVIKCVFGFLPLDDIENCRLVSRQWNSTAEVLLRKRAKIHFRTDCIRPETFLAVSKFSLPDLPFSAFKFSERDDAELYWRGPELEDFFEKWGKNIKELNLDNINIESADDSLELLTKYDVTPWFENASKITSLAIACSKEGVTDEDEKVVYENTSMSLGNLGPLPDIKTVILKENSIANFSAEGHIRMAPVNIDLTNITCTRNDEYLQQFRYNDFFDFSQAVTIKLNNGQKKISEVTFDMGDQVFKNTDLLYLNKITVENWENAQGSVRSVEVRGIPFTVKNNLKIQSLKITGESLDLFTLPPTVERIKASFCDVSCSQPLCLPKLEFLNIHWDEDNSSHQLTNFQLDKCENLKELVLSNYGDEETSLTEMFNVRSLPINLQTLRIKGNLQSYLTDDWILEMPSGFVVFDATVGGSRLTDYTRIAEMFRVGTLVVICHMHMNISPGDIVEYLLANMQRETKRIFLGMKCEEDDLVSQIVFEGSLFSTLVDTQSNYYEFENVRGIRGKAITREQFFEGCISVGDELIPFFTEGEINDTHVTS